MTHTFTTPAAAKGLQTDPNYHSNIECLSHCVQPTKDREADTGLAPTALLLTEQNTADNWGSTLEVA